MTILRRLIAWSRRTPRRTRWLTAGLLGLLAVGGWARFAPLPTGLLDEPPPSTLVVDRRGVPLYEARAADGARTMPLTAASIPPALIDATLAAEDRRFWWHPGVDPIAIVRAARINLAERSIVEGGSTITQQVAKLLLARRSPDRARGWRAKVQEALIALRLEHRLSKREILAQYLNLASYGNQIAGAERASRAYFGTPASMLTPAQAAFLAGLPQRPSKLNPYRNRNAAIARQRTILHRMKAAGVLTDERLRLALDERLNFRPAASPFLAPHFVEMVLAEARRDAGAAPDRIETSLDADLQQDVAGIIESHRESLRRHGAHNVAVVVLHNTTGEWLAWEGSGDYTDDRHGGSINGALVPRQPGSTLKPFTYALAFEQGFTPATVLADVPASFPTAEEGIVYTPRNYDGRFRGPLLARAALAGSENVPSVQLASKLGVPSLLRFLTRAGLTTFDRTAAYYGLGLTLGNAEVKLSELTAAYAALARGGEWIAPSYLRRDAVEEGRDEVPVRRLVSARTAFWIGDILSDAEAREYTFGRGGSLELPFPVAVKTGTSQAYHDNWTIGYSRRVTVGVWVGNFDRTPLKNSSGVTGAAPIFHAVMLAAERRVGGEAAWAASVPVSPPTSDTARAEICVLSGGAANAWCPARRGEWVPSESHPLPCGWHHLADDGVHTYLPAEYAAWDGFQGVPGGSRGFQRVPGVPGSSGAGSSRPASTTLAELTIVSPADGATFLIDPTLRREFQAITLKATAAGGDVEWSVNGRMLGTSDAAPLEWPLVPGRHRFTARDSRGRTAEATIVVR